MGTQCGEHRGKPSGCNPRGGVEVSSVGLREQDKQAD